MSGSFSLKEHRYTDEYGQNVLRIRAMDGNEILGSLYGGYTEDCDIISLDSIHVNMALRGQGIGSALLRKFIETMQTEGVNKIVGEMKTEYGLYINETIRFYEKHGFEVGTDFSLTRRL